MKTPTFYFLIKDFGWDFEYPPIGNGVSETS